VDHRLSVRAAATDRAARRRLIYLLLRNGDIGSLAGGERQLRDQGPMIGAADPHAPVGESADHEPDLGAARA
jgi:hypothetical protein